jgi:sRNA-binding carbon storage regulator CsrA
MLFLIFAAFRSVPFSAPTLDAVERIVIRDEFGIRGRVIDDRPNSVRIGLAGPRDVIFLGEELLQLAEPTPANELGRDGAAAAWCSAILVGIEHQARPMLPMPHR